jgi:hypothetical protein
MRRKMIFFFSAIPIFISGCKPDCDSFKTECPDLVEKKSLDEMESKLAVLATQYQLSVMSEAIIIELGELLSVSLVELNRLSRSTEGTDAERELAMTIPKDSVKTATKSAVKFIQTNRVADKNVNLSLPENLKIKMEDAHCGIANVLILRGYENKVLEKSGLLDDDEFKESVEKLKALCPKSFK